MQKYVARAETVPHPDPTLGITAYHVVLEEGALSGTRPHDPGKDAREMQKGAQTDRGRDQCCNKKNAGTSNNKASIASRGAD